MCWRELSKSWLVGKPISCLWRVWLFSFKHPLLPSLIILCNARLFQKNLLDNIDRVNRNFLWGSTNDAKKVHWVGWHKITKPKEKRDLGIQAAKGRNQALLAKLNWRYRMEKDAL